MDFETAKFADKSFILNDENRVKQISQYWLAKYFIEKGLTMNIKGKGIRNLFTY